MTIRTKTKTVYCTSLGEEFDTMEEAEKQELIDDVIEYCGSYNPDARDVVEYIMRHYTLTKKEQK